MVISRRLIHQYYSEVEKLIQYGGNRERNLDSGRFSESSQ
jgi:hypothetical protein